MSYINHFEIRESRNSRNTAGPRGLRWCGPAFTAGLCSNPMLGTRKAIEAALEDLKVLRMENHGFA